MKFLGPQLHCLPIASCEQCIQTMDDEGTVRVQMNIFQQMACSGFRPAFFLDHTVAA